MLIARVIVQIIRNRDQQRAERGFISKLTLDYRVVKVFRTLSNSILHILIQLYVDISYKLLH